MKQTDLFWNETLNILKKFFSKEVFETYISKLHPLKIEEGVFYLKAPDINLKEYIISKYFYKLQDLLKFAYKKYNIKRIEIVLKEDDICLNPKYTFDTFVVGKNNEFAYVTAREVAKNPGKVYNPLFIYGGVGLGKTHLMHAIGNYILEKNPKLKIIYVPAEEFINELILAIQNNKVAVFKEKYKNLDLLLVDDIQFLAGKEKSQEEFFHVFNYLYGLEKQIVITSDSPPSKIPNLMERLKSRFEWGVIVDISPPDFETRLAILKKKCELENIKVPDEVLEYLAKIFTKNIRELEGALLTLKAQADLLKLPLSLELAKKLFKKYENDNLKKLDSTPKLQNLELNDLYNDIEEKVNIIKQVVANYFNIQVQALESPLRKKEVAQARHIAMFLCREKLNLSYKQIAKYFKRKDHTTVMHGVEKVQKDENLYKIAQQILKLYKF